LAATINKRLVKELIQLKGTVVGKDLEELYRNCNMFVGMGITLLLAASCAKPSIIAGFTPETNKFAWGFWGENDLDANIIAISSPENRNGISFQSAIEIIIESDTRRNIAGSAAFKMFKENYDYDYIMMLWKKQYYKIIEICKVDGALIEKELKYYDWSINFYREIRRVVKLIGI